MVMPRPIRPWTSMSFDSEHIKIGILASLAHGFWVSPSQIYVEGIQFHYAHRTSSLPENWATPSMAIGRGQSCPWGENAT